MRECPISRAFREKWGLCLQHPRPNRLPQERSHEPQEEIGNRKPQVCKAIAVPYAPTPSSRIQTSYGVILSPPRAKDPACSVSNLQAMQKTDCSARNRGRLADDGNLAGRREPA